MKNWRHKKGMQDLRIDAIKQLLDLTVAAYVIGVWLGTLYFIASQAVSAYLVTLQGKCQTKHCFADLNWRTVKYESGTSSLIFMNFFSWIRSKDIFALFAYYSSWHGRRNSISSRFTTSTASPWTHVRVIRWSENQFRAHNHFDALQGAVLELYDLVHCS